MASVVLWLAATVLAVAQEPLRGVALVIGNGDYEHLAPLANPPDDADAIEELLSDLGFDSVRRTDRDADDLAKDLERFVEDAEDADVAVLYYAGHGVEAGGENWLVPVDADISALDAAAVKLVPVSDVIRRLRETVPVTIVLLDACRDNPFPDGALLKTAANADPVPLSAGGLTVTDTRGAGSLAKADEPASSIDNLGIVIGFAAAPGQVALDGTEGENSPYAAALIRHIAAMAGEEFGTVMRMVAEEVYLKTDGRQRPWVNESLRRLLYFGEAPEEPTGDEGDILAERRQLLLTISALPDFSRSQVERIAGQVGVPMDAVYGMLKVMGADAPDDPVELEKLLHAKAREFAEILAEREELFNPNPEIVRLTRLADRAELEGLLAKADELRERATAIVDKLRPARDAQFTALRQRDIEDSLVYIRSGQTKSLRSRHKAAAADFRKAFAIVEKWDDWLAWVNKSAEVRSLLAYGMYQGKGETHDQAVAEARRAVAIADKLDDRSLWLTSQDRLGLALVQRSVRSAGTADLDAAVEVYRAALEINVPRDLDPQRLSLQSNLGTALTMLGHRDAGTTWYRQAVDAFRSALRETDGQADQETWAQVQSSLGVALTALGNRERNRAHLVEAVVAYQQALTVRTRDAFPIQWATTKSNIGVALQAVGALGDGTESLVGAIDSLRGALEVLTPGSAPFHWATAQSNLGLALKTLGDRTKDVARLDGAVAAYEAALRIRRKGNAPLDWAETTYNLGIAHFAYVMHGFDTSRLDRVSKHISAALEVWSPETAPEMWLRATHSLGMTQLNRGWLYGSVDLFDDAKRAFIELRDYQRSVGNSAGAAAAEKLIEATDDAIAALE